MNHSFRYLACLFAALSLAGCAAPAPSSPSAGGDREIAILKQNQRQLSDQMAELQKSLSNIQRQLDLQVERFDQLSGATVAEKDTAPSQMAEKPPSPTPPPSVSGVKTPPSSATEIYRQAFSDYASGRYDRAIAGFKEFLETFPDNEYAANAQFWIGECYYSQQDYEQAASQFIRMANTYPQSGRTPDALFKAAKSYQAMGRDQQASQLIEFLRQRYPNSAAATKNLEF